MNMRTPLKKARHLGSAKEGTTHFWLQRVTAIANLVLAIYLVWLIASLAGANYETVRTAMTSPITALLLLFLILSGTAHMRLGMQTIIEDYIHSEGAKVVALILNTFFAVAIAAASIWAVLKLSFGA